MKLLFILMIGLFLIHPNYQSQGCVAFRNLAGFGQFAQKHVVLLFFISILITIKLIL
jgi:hypothetical protein